MLNNLLHIFSNSPRLAAKRLQQGVTEGGRSSSARSRSPGRAGRAGARSGAGAAGALRGAEAPPPRGSGR